MHTKNAHPKPPIQETLCPPTDTRKNKHNYHSNNPPKTVISGSNYKTRTPPQKTSTHKSQKQMVPLE